MAVRKRKQRGPSIKIPPRSKPEHQAVSCEFIHLLIVTLFTGVWVWVGHIVVAGD